MSMTFLIPMEVNVILPAFAAISVVLLIGGKLFYKIRTKFSLKVNCWFCNSNTSVPYKSSNSWYCPHCDQYNGFWPDGSYNRLLQDQYNEKLNCGSWCSKIKKKGSNSNGLCNFCNVNLQLKVQQLAQFVPFNKENYDEEVQQYSNQLERVYRLCSRCQVVLDKTLKEKYKSFVTDQLPPFKSTFDIPIKQMELKQRHPAYLCLSTLLSLGLLFSAVPYKWPVDFLSNYTLPDCVLQMTTFAQQYFPDGVQPSMVLAVGVITHVVDCALMRDITSSINLLLWIIVLSLTYIPVAHEYLPTILLAASIVLFGTSIGECKKRKTKSIAAVQLKKLDVKPSSTQQLDGKSSATQKLNGKPHITQKNTNSVIREERLSSIDNSETPNSYVSDPKHPHPAPAPTPTRELTPEDFGFGKLNVSSRRVKRSQTKHFPTKIFGSQPSSDIYRPRSVNLSPPKLQLDKSFDYQTPLTRSSSQSSGFVSLSHQKYLNESRSPSVVAEDLDSASQCGGNTLIPYSSPSFSSPFSLSHSYSMPYPQFPPPYAIMHFTPDGFNKFYQFSPVTSYESTMNMSMFSTQSYAEKGWFQIFKSTLSSAMFLFLITSNIAILWKVFGEDYFNMKT